MALEWLDVDFGKRQICVQMSEWKGRVTIPQGGRLRYIAMTVRRRAARPAGAGPPRVVETGYAW